MPTFITLLDPESAPGELAVQGAPFLGSQCVAVIGSCISSDRIYEASEETSLCTQAPQALRRDPSPPRVAFRPDSFQVVIHSRLKPDNCQ